MSKRAGSTIKPQVYKDPRPAEYFDRFHRRTRSQPPDFVYDIVRLFLTPYMLFVYRARTKGAVNVPTSGSVILAPNHFSFLDHFFVGCFTRRKVSFMAKSQLFKRPLQFVFNHGGTFPVRRGFRDEDAFITGRAILNRGGCIGMYSEGGRSRGRALSREVRPGIGRLALESGAWVVPVAIYGSEGIRDWKRLRFPRVTVSYGKPIRWPQTDDPPRELQQAVATEIFDEVRALYTELQNTSGKAKT